MASNHKRSHFDSWVQSVCNVFDRFFFYIKTLLWDLRVLERRVMGCWTVALNDRSKPELQMLVNVISWLLAFVLCGVGPLYISALPTGMCASKPSRSYCLSPFRELETCFWIQLGMEF